MKVSYVKHNNVEDNRLEFLLVNYDYIDGNELIARIMSDEFWFSIVRQIDGIWYKIIRIKLDDSTYELLWHEDFGNSIYSLSQADSENELLEERLKRVIEILNERFVMKCITEIKKSIEKCKPHLGCDNRALRNYNLLINPCVSDSYLKELESEYNVQLPEEYREYMKNIGNGGNQPDSGMLTVEQSLSLMSGQDCDGGDIEFKDLSQFYFAANQFDCENLLGFYYETFGQGLEKSSLELESSPTVLDDYFSEDGVFKYQYLRSENKESFIEYESAMKTHMLIFSFDDMTRTQYAIALDGKHKDQVIYYSYEPVALCMSEKNLVYTGVSFLEWMQSLYENNCDTGKIK